MRLEQAQQAGAALAVLFLALAQDAQRGGGGGAVVLAPDVFVGLDQGADLARQGLVVGELEDQRPALGAAVEDAAGLVVEAIVIGQGGDDREHQIAIGAVAVRVQVA